MNNTALGIFSVLTYVRACLEINSAEDLSGTPSMDGNLATVVKIRKAHTLLGIYSADMLKHAKYLVHKVLRFSIYL